MRTIVFLINSLEGGGAERVVSYLANNMLEETVHLVVLDDKIPAYILKEHIKYHVLGVSNFLKASYFFSQWLKENAPESIVVSFLNRSNYVNVISNVFFPHVTLLSERNTVSKHFANKGAYGEFNKILIKTIYRFSKKIIAVSSGVKKDLIENYSCNPELVSVINNPVDCDKINILLNDEPALPNNIQRYVCSVGRLNKQKRFDVLIKAFASVDKSLSLLILGEGEERDNLLSLISEHGLENRVFLVGFKSNPYPYINRADIFVLSSDYEGFPNALLEALSIGKAVVSTDCESGPRDILGHDQEFGLLVPTGDDTKMAEAINRLNEDAELKERYESLANKRISDNYSIDTVVNAYKKCFSEFYK